MITHKELIKRLKYDPVTGIFTWLTGRKPGTQAGSSEEYTRIKIDKKRYLAHRLAWFYMYKQWPKQLDHKDTDSKNNAITNLRECTYSQNNSNRTRKNSNAPAKGVFKRGNKYRSSIGVNGKIIILGYFDTVDEASNAYQKASLLYHGKFSNVN